MGLLDLMNRPGVRQGLGLLAAAGPSPVPMSFGQRAMGLLGQMDAEKRAEEERQAQAQMRALQQQLLQAQLGERQDMAADRRTQRDQAALDQQLLRQRFTPMDGPMPDGGPLMPRVDPADFIAKGGSLGGVQNLMALDQAMRPQVKPADYKVVGNALVQVGPEGVREAYRAPDKPERAPTAVQEYEFARQQGYKGSFLDFQLAQRRAGASQTSVSYGAPVAGTDAQGNPVFFQPSREGGAPAIIQGVAPPKKDAALTEAQAKAATFRSQMRQAEEELKRLPQAFDPTKLSAQVETQLAAGPTNLIVGEAAQRARQAQEQWAESALRFKTGAAATRDEVLMNVRTFFPQPGDTPAVIEQKARARKSLERDLEFAAGMRSQDVPAAAGAADPLGLRGGR